MTHLPVSVKRIRKQFRIVESHGRIAKTPLGHAVDGGGHGQDLEKALRQALHVNSRGRQ